LTGLSAGVVSLEMSYPWAAYLIAIFAVAGVSIWLYRPGSAPIGRGSRVFLATLRAIGLALVVSLLFDPVLNLPARDRPSAPVVVLLDDSESSRLLMGGRLDSLAEKIQSVLDGEFETARWRFGRKLSAEGVLSGWDRRASAIGDALTGVARRSKATGLLGVVLLSDGRNNAGCDPVEQARESPFPVFPVVVFPEREDRMSLSEVRAPGKAYLGQPVPVEVGVRSRRIRGGKVAIKVADGPVELARKTIELPAEGELDTEILFTPPAPGERFIRVSVDTVAGELSSENNSRLIALRVRKMKTSIGFLQQKLDWDYSFLSRLVREREDTEEVDFGPPKKGPRVPDIEGILGDRKRLEKVKVLFLSGLQRGLDEQARRNLLDFVAAGGGLALVASERGLGWVSGNIPEELVPVELEGSGEVTLSDVQPTLHGLRDQAISLGKDSSACLAVWHDLPPVATSGMVRRVRPGGMALLTTYGSGSPKPVLVGMRYGKGRVLVADLDGFWRWGFTVSGTGREGVFESVWNGLLSWLSKPEAEPRLNVAPEKDVFLAGEEVKFSGAGPGPYLVEVDLRNERTGETDSLAMENRGGLLEATFQGLEPGVYRYTARALDEGGRERFSREGRFAVDDLSLEAAGLSVDADLLRAVARGSGGETVSPDSLGELAGRIRASINPDILRTRIRFSSSPLYFVILVSVFAAEWVVRRRKGLM